MSEPHLPGMEIPGSAVSKDIRRGQRFFFDVREVWLKLSENFAGIKNVPAMTPTLMASDTEFSDVSVTRTKA